MYRICLSALAVLLLFAGSSRAEEKKGTIKAIDIDKSTITLTIDGKEVPFTWNKETKFVDAESGKALGNGPKAMRFGVGKEVTVKTEKKDGKDVVVSVSGKKPS